MVAIYARQSLDKKDSVSIETQIDMCKRICDANNWEYIIYKDKGFSGKNLSRPEFQQMMKDLQTKDIHTVMSYKLDRISRSLFDFLSLVNKLKDMGIEFYSATENIDTSTPAGRAMISIILTFAQLERETLSDRVSDNVEFRALSGQFIGGKVILGFDKKQTVLDGKKAYTLIENSEAELVKYIYSEYLKDNTSIRKIAYDLNTKGIKTKGGYTWDANRVSAVLQNILYTKNHVAIYNYFFNSGINIHNELKDFDNKRGLFIFNRLKGKVAQPIEKQTLIVTNHEGFIEAEDWIKVQEKMKSRKDLAPRYGQSNITVLSGIARCGYCGKVLTSSVNIKGRKNPYRSFKCPNRQLATCTLKCIHIDKIEGIVEEALINYCEDEKVLQRLMCQADDIPKENQTLLLEKETCQAEINQLDSKINKLVYSLTEDEGISAKYIKLQIEEFDKEKQKYLKRIAEISTQISMSVNENLSLSTTINAIKNFRNFYDALSFQEKKIAMQSIIKAVYIKENEVKITFFMVRSEPMYFAVHSIGSREQTTTITIPYNLLLEKDFDFNVFADVLLYERKKRKMSRNQLAAIIGTNYRNMQNWEYEKHIPSDLFIKKIEKALDIDLSRFYREK